MIALFSLDLSTVAMVRICGLILTVEGILLGFSGLRVERELRKILGLSGVAFMFITVGVIVRGEAYLSTGEQTSLLSGFIIANIGFAILASLFAFGITRAPTSKTPASAP